MQIVGMSSPASAGFLIFGGVFMTEPVKNDRFEKMLKQFMKKSNESKKALRQREQRKQGKKPRPQVRRNERNAN